MNQWLWESKVLHKKNIIFYKRWYILERRLEEQDLKGEKKWIKDKKTIWNENRQNVRFTLTIVPLQNLPKSSTKIIISKIEIKYWDKIKMVDFEKGKLKSFG